MTTGLRIGDAERDSAVTALGEHFAAGRIDQDEFDERSAAAWNARTSSDLQPLFADLPSPSDGGPVEADRVPEMRRGRRSMPPLWGSGVVRTAILVLVVTLAVMDTIPWFVAAIAVWVWFAGGAPRRMYSRHRPRPRPRAHGLAWAAPDSHLRRHRTPAA